MIIKKAIILCLIHLALIVPSTVSGQPEACDIDNPEMTSTCAEACVICDVDGFTGRHDSDVEGTLPADFCTMRVHNAQWIAFQAGSTSLRIRLSVSNCDIGAGLELGIYRSNDCNDFTLISECRGAQNAVPEGTSAEFVTTETLVIGQFYYLAMDGNRADNCDWTFEVLDGSTEIAPLTVTAPIVGSNLSCPGVLQTYTTEPEIGAVIFDWTLDGQTIGDNTIPSIDLSLDDPGTYLLCVTARNACADTDPVCQAIEIVAIPPTTIVDQFCADDCFEMDGNVFCDSGTFSYDIPLANGCDSTIIVDLTQLDQAITDLEIKICEGDSIFIGDMPFFTEGTFSETIISEQFCDSIVNLDLSLIVCNIQSSSSTTSITCFGESNGTASFSVTNGAAPFSYNWQHLESGTQGSGMISNTGENIMLTDLPVGTIIVQIDDNYGNSDILQIEIIQPQVIEVEATLSAFNEFNMTCNGSNDGEISLSTTGGQEPYMYSWSNGQIGPTVDNLVATNYIVTLTDNLGCTSINEYQLTEPDMIDADISFINPNCDGLETGRIEIITIEGGALPYLYTIDGSDFFDTGSFTQLGPDDYTLTIVDANMCIQETTNALTAPQIPILFGTTDYVTQLGCEIQLDIDINDIEINNVIWVDTSYLDCIDCFDPIATPLNSGENMIIVSSMDDCNDTLTINVEVEKLRQFYVPNIFTPNGDGQNDRFGIFGGKEVERIELQIFDRWGNKVFSELNMEPIDDSKSWDGSFNDIIVETGVYVWMANIFYIDGQSEVHSGDVTLIK